jgi:hypothetical protein
VNKVRSPATDSTVQSSRNGQSVPNPFWQSGSASWEAGASQPAARDSTYAATDAAWSANPEVGGPQSSYGDYGGNSLGHAHPANIVTPQDTPLSNDQNGHHQLGGDKPYDTRNNQPEGAYVGRSLYFPEDTPIDETRARAYASRDEAPLSQLELKTLDLWKSFDLPPRPVRQSLIDTFMQRCYPFTPILNPQDLETHNDRMPSQLLMQAVFLAASRVSSAPGVKSYASSEHFYQRAKALFWCGHEKNPLTVIAATIFLHWYNADGPEHVSFDTSRFWSHISAGLAHQVGLHKEPVGVPDIPFRRRLWWSLVVSQISILDCLKHAKKFHRPEIVSFQQAREDLAQ